MDKKIEVYFRPIEEFKRDVKKAIRDRTKLIQPKSHVYFESVETFRKFMTIQKIEILSLIKNKHPKSIYELAKMVDRDFASVLRDCSTLEGSGFIALDEKADPRGSKAPKLAFPYSAVVVHYPSYAYRIQFDEAA